MKLQRRILPHYFYKARGSNLWHLENKNGQEICKPVKLQRAGNKTLEAIAYNCNVVNRDELGNVIGLILYELDTDSTTPEYFRRLSLLSNLNFKQL